MLKVTSTNYKAPEDIQIINFTKKRELLSHKTINKEKKKENIYFNGKGTQNKTMYDMLFN